MVVGSSRSRAGYEGFVQSGGGRAAVLEQRLSSPLNGTTTTMTAAPGHSERPWLTMVLLLRVLARVLGRQVDSCLNWFAEVGANRSIRIAKLAVHLSLIAYDVRCMSPSRSQRGEFDREHGTRVVACWNGAIPVLCSRLWLRGSEGERAGVSSRRQASGACEACDVGLAAPNSD